MQTDQSHIGYDANSNRIGQTTGTDSYDYAVDAANRLIEEDINRFVVRTADRFQLGTLSQVDSVTSAGALELLGFADSFPGTAINCDRWRLTMTSTDTFGFETRQNGGMGFAYPRGWTNMVSEYDTGVSPVPPYDAIGLAGATWSGAEHRTQFTGDLDVQVKVNDYQGAVYKLIISDTPLERYNASTANYAESTRTDASGGTYRGTVVKTGTTEADNSVATTDTTGKLRLTRCGSTITTYYWNNGTSSWT